MADEARSESVLRHFKSRSQQPNTWKTTPNQTGNRGAAYEQHFTDQVSDLKFKYVGTSKKLDNKANMSSRHITQRFMQDKA